MGEPYATPKLIDEIFEKAYDLTPPDVKSVRQCSPRTNASFEQFEDIPDLIRYMDKIEIVVQQLTVTQTYKIYMYGL